MSSAPKEAPFSLQPAPLESGRFGLRVLRGRADELDARNLRQALLTRDADLAIIRTPSDGQAAGQELERAGFPYLHADVLVYYDCRLDQLMPRPLKNSDCEFVLCNAELAPALAELVRVSFADYRNHYMANPYLPTRDILAGFQEWALSYAAALPSGRSAWLVRRAGNWVAFATCSVEGSACEGVLYGVHPEHAGSGLYSDLIRFTQAHFKGLGCDKMRVSTQVHNFAVQKVWSREGFHMSASEHTWHVNAMLSRSLLPVYEAELDVSPALIQAYADVSGDHNPLHFDDELARQVGLPERVAHGLLANGWISKVLGQDFPGAGTLLQGYRYLFLKPMLPNQRYTLRVSTLQRTPRGGWQGLARINDAMGAAVLLAYVNASIRGRAEWA